MDVKQKLASFQLLKVANQAWQLLRGMWRWWLGLRIWQPCANALGVYLRYIIRHIYII